MLRKMLLHASLFLILSFLLSGCIAQYQAPESNIEDTGRVIVISDFHFNPGTVRVEQGSLVTWKNLDIDPHSVLFDGEASKELKKGETYTLNMSQAGTFDYTSGNHPFIKGTIIVTDESQ